VDLQSITFKMEGRMENSKRDRIKDILRLEFEALGANTDRAYELACYTADLVFDTLGIAPREQDKP
jgi:hypothetical protein